MEKGYGMRGMGLEISVQFLFFANGVQKSLVREVWPRFLTAQTVCRLGTLETREQESGRRSKQDSGNG